MDEWDPFILLAAEKQEENKLGAGSWSAGNVGPVADGRVGLEKGEEMGGCLTGSGRVQPGKIRPGGGVSEWLTCAHLLFELCNYKWIFYFE